MPESRIPEELFHGSPDPDLEKASIEGFLHVGTLQQAEMRHHRHLYRITLRQSRLRTMTMRDKGSWKKGALQRASRKKDVVCYLNRFEGISQEHLSAATSHADSSDATFARNVPSATHSWIILDPEIIRTMERIR